MAKLVKEEVIAGLKEMNRAEIRDLVSAIETEFGAKAAAAVAAAPAAAAAQAGYHWIRLKGCQEVS